MITALPFFPGLLGSPIQGNGQTGGIGLDQPMTPGNLSDNPFAKILRDQSAASFLIASVPLTVPTGDQRRLPEMKSYPDTLDLSLQELAGRHRPGVLLGENSSESMEWPLSVHVQPHPLPATFLTSDEQGLGDIVEIVPTSLSPLPSFGVEKENGVGNVEMPQEPMRLLPVILSHDERLSGTVFSPQVFLGGRVETDGIQTQGSIPKSDLHFLAGYPPIQAPPPSRIVSDNSAIPMVPNSDPQQFLRDAVKEFSQLVGSSVESPDVKPDSESAGESGKIVEKILDRVSSPVQDATKPLRISPSPAESSQGLPRPLVTQAFQSPFPFEETTASPADGVLSTQSRMKYVIGVPSLLSGWSVYGKESAMGIQSELNGESNLFLPGERLREVFEATGKSMGVDTNGGQGANNGMGGNAHSQSGFQQSSSSLSPGPGVRMAEERGPELPTPALQRLQMEVQLSETNRVQIDVGVQQRQVYAGLLMDQATLKNLAVQFVPQLEEQLAQSDMDLQEFSAEVRDHHREQESATDSDWRASQQGHRASTTFSHAQESNNTSVTRVEERGWHYVA